MQPPNNRDNLAARSASGKKTQDPGGSTAGIHFTNTPNTDHGGISRRNFVLTVALAAAAGTTGIGLNTAQAGAAYPAPAPLRRLSAAATPAARRLR